MLGRKTGQLPAAVPRRLPPVERHHPPAPVPEPPGHAQGRKPRDRRGEVVHRPGIHVVVMVVGKQGEGVGRNSPYGDAGRMEPFGQKGAGAEMGVGQKRVAAVLDHKRAMAHPGEGGGALRLGQIITVIGHRGNAGRRPLRRPPLVPVKEPHPVIAQWTVPPLPPGVEPFSGPAVGRVEGVRRSGEEAFILARGKRRRAGEPESPAPGEQARRAETRPGRQPEKPSSVEPVLHPRTSRNLRARSLSRPDLHVPSLYRPWETP